MFAMPEHISSCLLGWPALPKRPSLAGDEVHVICASIDVSAHRQEALAALLSGDERERAARFAFSRDRDRFVARHGLLRELLSNYLHRSAAGLQFSYTKTGKPEIGDQPHVHAVRFSMAHSDSVAVFALTSGEAIGVDVEIVRAIPDLPDLVESLCSARELEQWRRLDSDRQLPAFFDLWSRKEAFLKGTGEGLGKSPNEIEVLAPSQTKNQRISVFDQGREVRPWSLYSLSTAEYAIAVAFKGRPGRILCWEWESH
jgi:4'-phosphopantetheinyl transferase